MDGATCLRARAVLCCGVEDLPSTVPSVVGLFARPLRLGRGTSVDMSSGIRYTNVMLRMHLCEVYNDLRIDIRECIEKVEFIYIHYVLLPNSHC